MGEISFGDFLNKMSGETSPKKKPQKTEHKKPRRKVITEQEENPKQEPKQEQPMKPKEASSQSDDIVVKALDYSTRFLKIIYQNFKNEAERKVVLQSIRSAIDLALRDQPVDSTSIAQNQKSPVQSKSQPKSTQQKTDENIELHMNDLSGQQVEIEQQQPHPEPSDPSAYNRNLNLGLKVTNEGKQEVDLSRVSSQDMREMMVLAGVDEDQKKKEKQQSPMTEEQIQEIESGESNE